MLTRIIKQIPILKTTGSIVRGLATDNEFLVTGTLVTEKYLAIGQHAQVTHIFSQNDVNSFAELCGDNNPLHSDPEFAKTTMFKGTIVHVIARMEILSIEDKRKGLLMTCSTVVTLQDDQIAVVGEAKVLVPKPTQ